MSTIVLAIFTLISKALGLVRDILLAKYYGATSFTDIFVISITIPVVLLESISSAVLVNYIPIINSLKKKDEKISYFNGILILSILILTSVLIAVFYLFGKTILHFFALGFDSERLELLFKFSKITILSAYFIILGDVFKAYCQNEAHFYSTAISSIIVNILVIIGICLSDRNNIVIVNAFLIGNLITCLVLFWDAKYIGFKWKFNLNFRNETLKNILLLSIPILFNNAIWEINGIVDKSLVSTLGDGYVTALSYSNKITSIVVGIVTASIATIVYPKYARIVNIGETAKPFLLRDIDRLTKLICPVCVFCVINSEDIINFIFSVNSFSEELKEVVILSFRIYSIGMFFSCLKMILFKYYYSNQNTKVPAINTMIAIITNIILSITLIRFYGYIGVVSATAFSSFLTVMLLMFNCKCYNIKENIRNLLTIAVMVIISIIICMIISRLEVIVNGRFAFLLKGTVFVLLYALYFLFKEKDILRFDR